MSEAGYEEEFREIARKIFEPSLSWGEVAEIAYRWAELKRRVLTGAQPGAEVVPRREEVEYLRRRILELRTQMGLDNPEQVE
jgi:hypothetical protein